MSLRNEPRFVDIAELSEVSRKMMSWLNLYPDKPAGFIGYEFLDADAPGMALSTIQATYITEADILGAYEAEYQFKVIYRLKPGKSPDKRLKADEILNQLGEWAKRKVSIDHEPPELGENMQVLYVEPVTMSALFARYEDGYEDHQILMRMAYKVS